MEFRALGDLQVVEDGQALALGPHQQRAVLALLVLSAGEVVSSDRLIEALWGERPPATRGQDGAGLHLAAAQDAQRRASGDVSVGRADRHRRSRLRVARRSRAGRRARVRAATRSGPRRVWRSRVRCRGDGAQAGARAVARRAAGGLHVRRLRRGRHRAACRSCAWRRWRSASTPISRSAVTPRWSPSSRRSRPSIRCASACARRGCWPCIAAGANPRRWSCTARRAGLLVDELGMEPSPALRELHDAILRQDPALKPPAAPRPPPERRQRSPRSSSATSGGRRGRRSASSAGWRAVIALLAHGGGAAPCTCRPTPWR